MKTILVLAILFSAVLTNQSLAQVKAPKEIQVDKQEAHLLVASEKWAYWQTAEPIDKNGPHGQTRYTYRTYRQQIPAKTATLVPEANKGLNRRVVTIDANGALVVRGHRQIFWFRTDGTTAQSPKLEFEQSFLKVYDDGVIIKTRRASRNDNGPVMRTSHSFTPLVGVEPDQENSIEIRSETDPKFGRSEPVRHGRELVWMTAQGLRAFNLDTARRTELPMDNKNETEFNLSNCHATAFDGELVLLGGNVVVDAKSGARVATNWADKRISNVFLTNRGVGYRLYEGKLEAVELRRPDQSAVLLSHASKKTLITSTETGLLIWTGHDWKTVPWHVPATK